MNVLQHLLQQPSIVDALSTTAGCLSRQIPLIYTAAGHTLGITWYKKQYNIVSNNACGVDK